MAPSEGSYLINVETIPSVKSASSDNSCAEFPAYFVSSTAPNNVEDKAGSVPDPEPTIKQIAEFLCAQDHPEVLIAVHGYNTALGEFATDKNQRKQGDGVKGWYQDIRDHIVENCDQRAKGLVFIGYRWPSEQVKGIDTDSLGHKLKAARKSLPIALQVIVGLALVFLLGLSFIALTTPLSGSKAFAIAGISLLVVAIMAISIVLTLFILRITVYFRDSYRANNFGVPDLVEFIRQLDKAVREADPTVGGAEGRRIKLSFIGHSMGGFVVTNTMRILSDVFDKDSIGHTSVGVNKGKCPSPNIGCVFALGRLVLVAPDIPAETIITSRANFLASSLRRFEETYLFSNEGDMALKLASTAANYASFPSSTREGGYRLGNVMVNLPETATAASQGKKRYGIVNLDPTNGLLFDMLPRRLMADEMAPSPGIAPESEAVTMPESEGTGEPAQVTKLSCYLKYLYTLPHTSLLERQTKLIASTQRPIAELFTVFDCTDYQEALPNQEPVGILSYALGKESLNFWDYVKLTLAFFRGQIDTHGGYFCPGSADENAKKGRAKPEAHLSKQLIYGLACLGFQPLLATMADCPNLEDQTLEDRRQALQRFSDLCEKRGIQALLAAERYNQAILGIAERDRSGY